MVEKIQMRHLKMLCRPQNIFELICFPDSIYFSLNTDQISVVTDLTIIGQVKTMDNIQYLFREFPLKKRAWSYERRLVRSTKEDFL